MWGGVVVRGRRAQSTAATAGLTDHLRLSRLVREFETNGHFLASVDPLGLERDVAHGKSLRVSSLLKEAHGFTDGDLHKTFETRDEPALANFGSRPASLEAILRMLTEKYSGVLGVEFSHINNPKKSDWIRRNVILAERPQPTPEQRKRNLGLLAQAQAFEEFCSNKFSAATHFSLEGGEALIPGLEAVLEKACKSGVVAIEMGMAHRGRLNVLKNVLQVPFASLLDRFESYLDDDVGLPNNSDDVRYHLGASVERRFGSDCLRVALAANPSHLEAVNGVVLGKARARQFLLSTGGERASSLLGSAANHSSSSIQVDISPTEQARRAVMPLLLHGDASFFIGSVRESLGFSNLRDYTTGGTVHLIVNNQIGFTTLPKQAHSSTYCSDVAKSVGAPIFHVNADFPDDVVRICEAAVGFRQEFLTDVVINLWCFRRRGHNQSDAPEVTQPRMYAQIKRHPTVVRIYSGSAEEANEALDEARQEIEYGVRQQLGQITATRLPLNRAQSASASDAEEDVRLTWNERQVKDIPEHSVEVLDAVGGRNETKSGVGLDLLRRIGRAMFTLPPAHVFQTHPKAVPIFERRLRAVSGDDDEGLQAVRWDTAEQLALGSLMVDGVDCRLSGQDVERGTFNQRHAVLYSIDRTTGEEVQYLPWTGLLRAKDISAEGRRPANRRLGVLAVCNSPLSEESVLAFEHGYSLYSFSVLGIWEAQFGDFANCAQTVIDTFIASGEEKWVRQSGIVLNLPHGFDGQGPDHSSAHMERFLALASEDDNPRWEVMFGEENDPRAARKAVNMHVLNPTTPAQYFHALRRHMIAPFRKPLVIFSPKFLLHHGPCTSPLRDFGPELGAFRVVIGEPSPVKKWKRLVLCSGKLYFHLLEERNRRGLESTVALVRLEQLCPFPFAALRREFKAMFDACGGESPSIVWAQEEPKNKGPWTWVSPRLSWVLKTFPNQAQVTTVTYVGRHPSASPATGSYVKHRRELQRLLDKILSL